jgi:hypothetical protein
VIAVWLVGTELALIAAGALVAKLTWPIAPGRHRLPKYRTTDELAEIDAWLEQMWDTRK